MKEKLTKKDLQEKVEKLEDEVTNLKFRVVTSEKEKREEELVKYFFIGFSLTNFIALIVFAALITSIL